MRSTILLVLIVAAVVLVSLPVFAGDQISVIAMDSPSGTSSNIVDVIPQTATMLSGVPTSVWHYGCSATSAGMIFGYYDRHSYSNMYAGGPAPLVYDLAARNTIIATTTHQNDYWISYASTGPDPFEGNWPEHPWDQCTGDFMGTNQWKWDFIGSDGIRDYNTDGSTALFSYTTVGNKLYDYIPPASAGLPQTALCHGMKLFVESRGYQVTFRDGEYQNYTQNIDAWATGGFSFADFMAEINAGRPLMIGLDGHSMVGVGYDNTTGPKVYIHDTWDNNVHEMAWGSSYAGMDWLNVTCIELTPIPEPTTMTLFGLGILTIVIRRRRRS